MFSKTQSNLFSELKRLFSSPFYVYGTIIVISALALAGALISEYVFGLKPCILCIYQRIPYIVAIGLAVTGMLLRDYTPIWRCLPCGMSALAFGVNAGIAFHHTGVEQKWWSSFAEACAMEGIDPTASSEDLLKQIMAAPVVPCDEIPWVDPVFGLSMAVYNTLLSAGMFVACIIATIMIYRAARSSIDIKA